MEIPKWMRPLFVMLFVCIVLGCAIATFVPFPVTGTITNSNPVKTSTGTIYELDVQPDKDSIPNDPEKIHSSEKVSCPGNKISYSRTFITLDTPLVRVHCSK